MKNQIKRIPEYNKALVGGLTALLTTLIMEFAQQQGVELTTTEGAALAGGVASLAAGLVWLIPNIIPKESTDETTTTQPNTD